MAHPPKDLSQLSSLMELVATLRGPDGCPWDRAQDHRSLAPYAIEETCELVEALETGRDEATKEELGDVLFQVVLHAQLASERGAFTLPDVMEHLGRKMIRRHPHVFGTTAVASAQEARQRWDSQKDLEAAARGAEPAEPRLEAPLHLPALQRAAKIGQRTRKWQFDWNSPEEVLEKVREEMNELEEAFDRDNVDELRHELGDVLFSVAQLCRHLELDPEQVLRDGNRRFEGRFQAMIELCRADGRRWQDLTPEDREELWRRVKES